MILIILKWVSQILIIVSGIMGLFSKDTYVVDPVSKKGSLTRIGWATISALLIGFVLFVGTDIKERKENSEKDSLQKQQISSLKEVVEGQKEQLSLSQNIVDSLKNQISLLDNLTEAQKKQLLQLTNMSLDRDLSGIELSFTPSQEHWRRVVQAYNGLPSPDNQLFQHSTILAEKSGDYWSLTFTPVLRPQGLKALPSVLTNQPGWETFKQVLQVTLPSYFALEWDTKLRVVVSGQDSHPSAINISRDRITFTFRPPETRIGLSVLSSSDVTFKGWDYPKTITLTSLDPNVVLDQTIALSWKQVDDPNEDEYNRSPHFSGPQHLTIQFKNVSQ